MAYQVLARKWRPQRFDDVIGQRGVTRTLRNAIARERVAQAFVFAGPRGVGKTTTARILARALNCVEGPTADPCGECDVCREVAEGRDIDVLEIDAATHTQVDNVREVIISGLSISPVRDRHKVFIIDEVHQLSSSSFNALLKSVEEPPPHVVFIMATTLLDKIPDTILSRSQVFEFRTIGSAAIAEQLRTIVEAEGVAVDDAGLALVARAADGSMRDAQSALDQVIAFAGDSAGAEEVSAVLGLVGRDAVLDLAETVADEAAGQVFDLTGRFVEAGYDLRSVCRELSRLVRDLMVLKVDARRIADPEIALDAERDRLQALANRFSREDLLRGFDVLSRAEFDIRGAAQPRYHFEMAMLRWIHLRGLVPLAELLGGAGAPAPTRADAGKSGRRGAPHGPPKPRTRAAGEERRAAAPPESRPGPPAGATPAPAAAPKSRPDSPAGSTSAPAAAEPAGLKGRFLAELQRRKRFFHRTVAAQAREIAVEEGRITFVFAADRRTLAQQVKEGRSWLEALAGEVAGRKTTVTARHADEPTPPRAAAAAGDAGAGPGLLPPEPAPAAPAREPAAPPQTAAGAETPTARTQDPAPLGSPVEPAAPVPTTAAEGAQTAAARTQDPAPLGSPVEPAAPPTTAEEAQTPTARPDDPAPSPLGSPVQAEPPPDPPVQSEPPGPGAEKTGDLLAQAMDDPAVQTMLDVFPAEIKEVEEL